MRRRKRKKQKKIIILSTVFLSFTLITAYSAFSTNLSLTAKGNIKKYPAYEKLRNICNSENQDNLYKDTYEEGRCIYRGNNANNYLSLDNKLWRIVAIENDNTIKIVTNDSVGNMPFDEAGKRKSPDNYCLSDNGCNWWGNNANTQDLSGNIITSFNALDGSKYLNLPPQNSTLNTYLNETYIKNLDIKIFQNHIFNVGMVGSINGDGGINIDNALETEKQYKWNGYIGLLSASDYMKANLSSCTSIHDDNCGADNYLFKKNIFALINRAVNEVNYNNNAIRYVNEKGSLNMRSLSAKDNFEIYPVLFLKPDISISGKGTELNPYRLKK